MEATELPNTVLQYYEQLLEADPTNAVGLNPSFVYNLHLTHHRLLGNGEFLSLADWGA